MSIDILDDSRIGTYLQENRKVVIKFYADWCGACRLIAPKFKRISNDEKFNDVAFAEVNAEISPATRRWAGVTNLPFFAVVEEGKILAADAIAREDKLLEMINKLEHEN